VVARRPRGNSLIGVGPGDLGVIINCESKPSGQGTMPSGLWAGALPRGLDVAACAAVWPDILCVWLVAARSPAFWTGLQLARPPLGRHVWAWSD
jgi:hypothetical protein